MYITHDGQRLYLNSWNYNAALIFSELAKIIENAGGRVKPCAHYASISNRSITEARNEHTERAEKMRAAAERITDPEKSEKLKAAAAKEAEKAAELDQIDNTPRDAAHIGYISFVLNNVYYYYQTDRNPFFPFYYIKTPIREGKYSRDAACTEDEKTWLYDCFFYATCSDADRREAANLIFNMLVTAPPSEIIRDHRRQRVPNTYNSGYHYETVYSPERLEKISF